MSFGIGEKQEARIKAVGPVLPLPGLSIYWFPFGIERPFNRLSTWFRFGWLGFDDGRLLKLWAFSFNRREAY